MPLPPSKRGGGAGRLPPQRRQGLTHSPVQPPPVEDEIDLMVLEYLGHVGYDRAVEQMKAQLKEQREGKKPAWKPVGREMQEHVKGKMLRALDAGSRDEVMQLWQNFVPPLVRHTEMAAKKLECRPQWVGRATAATLGRSAPTLRPWPCGMRGLPSIVGGVYARSTHRLNRVYRITVEPFEPERAARAARARAA